MKKLLCALLTVLMLVPVLTYAETATSTPEPLVVETTEQKLERMLPVLDSFARNMGVDGTIVYDAASPEFVWTQLYLTGVNWFADSLPVTVKDDEILVPGMLLREFAIGSFYGLIELPPLTGWQDEASPIVTYDEATDTYALAGSDMAQTYIVIERYATLADGDLSVGFGLYDEQNVRLGGFTAVMTENMMPSNFDEPLFPYGVREVRAETPTDFDGLTVTTCSIRFVPEPETVEEEEPQTASDPQYATLSRGSVGDAVEALQRRLNELGYNCGSVDGVFGSRTRRAVRYFQDAIGYEQSGIATASLQRRLFASDAPKFQTYVTLDEGDSGIRVENLQSRLRALGYLADPVDGDFGTRTEAAVRLFQQAADLKVDGIAGINTLRALDRDSAPKCAVYIDLERGDTGYRVTEMQNQLIALGFLDGKASGRYDSETTAAVQAFMKAVGLDGDGRSASAELIGEMFAYVQPTPAPTATPEVTATPAPTATPEVTATPAPTATPEVTTTPAPTATPEVTDVPEPTEPPVELITPAPSDEPEATEVPETSDTPTEPPVELITPAPSGEPEATEVPETTDTPTESPVELITPAPSDEPVLAITEVQLDAFVNAVNATLQRNFDATEAVTWLQQALEVAPATGVYDATTVSAVKDLQRANDMDPTGLADAALIALLNAQV